MLGFSDKLVSQLLDHLEVQEGSLLLDPFCGTGTTLVESMKRGVTSVGIDASPFSCFVSRVKTDVSLEPAKLISTLVDVALEFRGADFERGIKTDTYRYIDESGMLSRGWIGRSALLEAIALKQAIRRSAPNASYRDALLLALTADISTKIGNMKYGPEIYCGPRKRSVDVWKIFESNVAQMVEDLVSGTSGSSANAKVYLGDARRSAEILRQRGIGKIDVAISSPPYPAEHDYTRNTRLELAFLDFVASADCVQAIKRTMIRSHTKGIYRLDNDGEHVSETRSVANLAKRVAKASENKTHGFARLYPTVVKEYFGGMKRHLTSMHAALAPRGRYALVVGDQASYLGTHVRTGELLGKIAEEVGFKVEDAFVWRTRTASTTSRPIKEHTLILRKRAA